MNNWHENIYMTEFGGPSDINKSAYDDKLLDYQDVFFALPLRLPKDKLWIEIEYKGKTVEGPVRDIGPHNIRDKDYVLGEARPLAEKQYKTKVKAQNNKVPRNPAGIDCSPAVMDRLGVKGPIDTRSVKEVKWRFKRTSIALA